MQVNVHEAKTTLSKLIARVESGEEVILTRRNQPVARLVPFREADPARVFGDLEGVFEVPDAFFEPLSEDELGDWER